VLIIWRFCQFPSTQVSPNPAEPEPKTGSWMFSKTPLNQHKHWLNHHPRKMSCQKQQRSVYRGTKLWPCCEDDSELVLLHQDAFAADYQEDEYTLLGMAIKYAGLRGKEVRVIGRNRSPLGEDGTIH
jgi:hypothetical protein